MQFSYMKAGGKNLLPRDVVKFKWQHIYGNAVHLAIGHTHSKFS